jgi:hypothetical protein
MQLLQCFIPDVSVYMILKVSRLAKISRLPYILATYIYSWKDIAKIPFQVNKWLQNVDIFSNDLFSKAFKKSSDGNSVVKGTAVIITKSQHLF